MIRSAFLLLTVTLSLHLSAATLPGFAIETLARAEGFVTSVVTDSKGTIYFTTTDGWIHRVDGSQTTRIASLPTQAGGDSGLLGMAMLDDNIAVVHYTTWKPVIEGDPNPVLDDVISKVDLRSGAESVLRVFDGDITHRPNGVPSHHHGGNPTVAPDGSIYVGIGEYGARVPAQKPEWNGGKIWRIDPSSGEAVQWALGMRNPYDLLWDPELDRLVVADNGQIGGDEIHVMQFGDNGGWPPESHPLNPNAPVYIFPMTVAPTGFVRMTGTNPMLRRGYLLGAFVTSAIYYFPSFVGAIDHPVAIVDEFDDSVTEFDDYVIDVTEAPNGDIIFATASWPNTAIHRLQVPKRGDCNGDGFTDSRDVPAMLEEIRDGGSEHPMIRAQEGSFAGSWGCDANADSVINDADLATLNGMISHRRRAVGRR